jgi:tetratricopeptide (TPR) repeat protein
MTDSSTLLAAPADVLQAQADYDAGRYTIALAAMRRLDDGDGAPAADGAALRLRCLAAYRLGELDEAADAALRLVALTAQNKRAQSLRFDVLTVSVVAAGELARFEQSIEHLQLVQQLAARAGSLADFVRGRGTMAACFALLGDPWAAQRLLAELVGQFQGGLPEQRLEATVRVNHAAVCLQIARLARQGSDSDGCEQALADARASIVRTRELAQALEDKRIGAFADVHAAELALLRGESDGALSLLEGAVAQADAAQLWAHARQLRLLEAEALQPRGDSVAALALLQAVGEHLRDGHEISVRIRWHSQLQRVLAAGGDNAAALDHFEQARTLAQYRQYRQARAQSRFLRARVELEHLYRFRAETTSPSPSARP